MGTILYLTAAHVWYPRDGKVGVVTATRLGQLPVANPAPVPHAAMLAGPAPAQA